MTLPLVPQDSEAFKLPDVRRPAPMPSLPGWAASRVALLTSELQRNPATERWEPTWTLPAALALTPMQRADVQQHAQDLRELCTPSNDDARLMELLTEFVCAKPSQGQNEISAAALGASLLAAVHDLPLWSVERAVIRFHRGEWGLTPQGARYDYRWCPPSADLRRAANNEIMPVRHRAEQLDRLARAVPRMEFSEEHCAMMRQKLLDLGRQLSTPLVGKDGSGGAAGHKPADAHCGTRPKAKPGLKREGGRRRGGDCRK